MTMKLCMLITTELLVWEVGILFSE